MALHSPPPKLYPSPDVLPHQQPEPAPRLSWLGQTAKRLVLQGLTHLKRGQLRLTLADGQTLTLGHEPQGLVSAALTIQDEEDFFKSILLYSHIGFAEAYIRGAWDSPCLTDVIRWFILNLDDVPMLEGTPGSRAVFGLLATFNRLQHRLRANDKRRASENIQAHYDLSNDFFALFLDPTLAYSSARYTTPGMTLEEAQQAKYAALVEKLRLQADDHLLEIGSGWGGFAIHTAQTTGCRVTTVTISPQQFAEAQARVEAAGLADRVTLRLQDYRELPADGVRYDKIVSVEMIEAVGDAYYEAFFDTCHRVLAPHGLLVLQMILCPDARYDILKTNVDFIQKHIFPGSLLPSLARLTEATRNTGDLHLFELDDMGLCYAHTLAEWHRRFSARLPEVHALGFDTAFVRKWQYYLTYCEAAFATRNITVAQATYTRPNNPRLWRPVES